MQGVIGIFSAGEQEISVLGRFEGQTLSELWGYLGVDEPQWRAWEVERNEAGFHPIVKNYPAISKIVWWHVDPVYFDFNEAVVLGDECTELLDMNFGSTVEGFLALLRAGANEVMSKTQEASSLFVSS